MNYELIHDSMNNTTYAQNSNDETDYIVIL